LSFAGSVVVWPHERQAVLQEPHGVARAFRFRHVRDPFRKGSHGAVEFHAIGGAGGYGLGLHGAFGGRLNQAPGAVGFRRVVAVDAVVERLFDAEQGILLRTRGQGQAAFGDLADFRLGQVRRAFGEDILQAAVGLRQLRDEGLAVEAARPARVVAAALAAGRRGGGRGG
jgi:hypothetical protein